MDAVDMLRADHERVEKLFQEYQSYAQGADGQRRRLAAEIFTELEAHALLEEELFYPAVEGADAEERTRRLIRDAYEAHHVARMLIAEMKRLDDIDDVFDAKMRVLQKNVESHVAQEEGILFLRAQTALGGELRRLGERMRQKKLNTPCQAA